MSWRPRQELNPYQQLRKLLPYPLGHWDRACLFYASVRLFAMKRHRKQPAPGLVRGAELLAPGKQKIEGNIMDIYCFRLFPAIRKSPRLFGNDGVNFDIAAFGQGCDFKTAARRRLFSEESAVGFIHLAKIAQISQKDR